ncbi:MAG TPA: ATP-binding protein [Aequorivita sp.]|nr:ATP-binding protein [Aequorivita sp.]
MKLSYKQKLFLYFLIIFSLFTIGIIVFAHTQEKKFRTEALEEKLDAYTEITNVALARGEELDSLVVLFPSRIRLTLIDDQGTVQFDNAIKDLATLENHSNRPELIEAKSKGKGSNIRTSSSTDKEYLYYVKHFNGYFIRTALPYDVRVQQFVQSDNLFLYYIIAMFLGMLILINLVATRFGNTIKQLRDLVISSDEKINVGTTKFPNDEFGEISEKIVDNYKKLRANKKKTAQEREKLLQHVHSSEEGICFFSETKKVEFFNGLFLQYLNLIADNANSEPTVLFSDAVFDKLNLFLASPDRDDYFETEIEKHSKHFSLRANIFKDRSFEIILNDITKQRKTQLLKQEMTGNIAHELRTPVTSIRGYLETVLEKSLDPEKERQFLTKAYNQALILSELIQDMGLITKIEEAPNSFRFESVNLSKVLSGLRNDLAIPLEEKGIEMSWSISDKVAVKSNNNLLYSIFRNLTDNVIRYAGRNVKISISHYNEDENFYYFLYSDTGVGIDDEQHFNRLFERFYRINEGRTRDSGGSGLGLSIVKNALSLHKGSITVKNRQGGGLEFLIKLPKA